MIQPRSSNPLGIVLAWLGRELQVIEPLDIAEAWTTRGNEAPGRAALKGERLAIQLVADQNTVYVQHVSDAACALAVGHSVQRQGSANFHPRHFAAGRVNEHARVHGSALPWSRMTGHFDGKVVAITWAVIGLTRTAALELATDNIRVNAVCPAAVETRVMRSLEHGLDPANPENVHAQMAAGIPLGRYAEPEEVAALVAFSVRPGRDLSHRRHLPDRRRGNCLISTLQSARISLADYRRA